MKEKTYTKAFRLNERDNALIETFLKKNPIFDLSTLIRTALLSFIENPNLELKRVSVEETIERSLIEDKDELDALAGKRGSTKKQAASS
jgi:hypothetical protein